jgi:hypothetical protein
MPEPNDPTGSTRREFTQRVAVAAVTPFLCSFGSAAGQEPAKPEGTAAVVQALTEIVRQRYGKHLDEDQLKAVQRSIGFHISTAERLSKFPLKNSDEPVWVTPAPTR